MSILQKKKKKKVLNVNIKLTHLLGRIHQSSNQHQTSGFTNFNDTVKAGLL